MHLKEYKRNKALKMLGLLRYEGREETERLTFIIDDYNIAMTKVEEYGMWYRGDEDELLNFYTKKGVIDYNFEPVYQRSKQDYFWTRSAMESDIKRTHSGQAKNIIDTLVNVVGEPTEIKIEGEEENEILNEIVEDNNLMDTVREVQMPKTLVEGWGAYKINWDTGLSDTPLIMYYSANSVDFFYKSDRLIGIMYKDFFKDEQGKKYLITETRYLGLDANTKRRSLFIEKEIFETQGAEEYIMPRRFEDFPQFAGLEPNIEIEGYDKLLSVPSIFFMGDKEMMYGKSVFTGKISLFDDLDQVWSQMANTTRKSTPIEYIDVNFLERDKKTGLPITPKAYDRKYTLYAGGRGENGDIHGEPVHVTQPSLNVLEYMSEAKEILVNIVSGLISPATIGIDISKKDNADAQREKEKITIFTRNCLVKKETKIIKSLLAQCMDAYELMHNGTVSNAKRDITVKFSEFADNSYDNKLGVLAGAFERRIISPEMLVSKLYSSGELSEEDRQREIDFITKHSQEPFEMESNSDGDPMYEDESTEDL